MKAINKKAILKELFARTEGLPTDFVLILKQSTLKKLLIECLMLSRDVSGVYSFFFDTDNHDWGVTKDTKTFGNYYSSGAVMTDLDELDDLEEEITPIVEQFIKELDGTFDTSRRIKYIILNGRDFNQLVELGDKRSFDMIPPNEIIEIMMSE